MSSPSNIRQSSKIIERRLKQTLQTISSKHQRGEIKSKSAYAYETKSAIRTFVSSLTSPIFKAKRARKVTNVESYNGMIEEIYQDIEVLYVDTDELDQIISDSFKKSNIERKSFQYRIKNLESQVKKIAGMIGETPHEVVRQETFMNNEAFDIDRVEGNVLKIWPEEGILTLSPLRSINHTGEASIQITGGNGLPGNTKEVQSIDGELVFNGEDNLRVNPAEIIDGFSDTWIEYESFHVDEEARRKTSNIGYTYEEGVSWASVDNRSLELELTVRFEDARIMNWISISPFLPAGKESMPPRIASIKLHDGKGRVQEIADDNRVLSEDSVVIFEKSMVKEITIKLEQQYGYLTDVGHFYYREKTKSKESHFQRTPNSTGRRVEGPSPSITSLGVAYDHETQRIVYPEVKSEEIKIQNNSSRTKLFYPIIDKSTESMTSGLESVSAQRKVIGIRDIDLATYEFEENGSYVSSPYQSQFPIESVSIETDESGVDDVSTFVDYYISPNDGNDWYRIKPRKSTKDKGKPLYIFNSFLPKEGQLDLFGYIDLKEDVKSIRVKIEISRSPEDIYKTPIIKGYKLNILTRKEGIQ